MKKWIISFLVALMAALSLLAPVHMLRHQYAEQAQQEHRNQANQHLMFIRNSIQSKLDSSLFYADFFEMVIRQNPDISDYELREYARLIVGRNAVVDHITITREGVISFVYPTLGNEHLIGQMVSDEEGQSKGALSTLENHLILTEGPLEWGEGGLKIFNQKPIFSRSVSSNNLWGFASVTIDFEELVDTTLLAHHNNDYRYGIRVLSESAGPFLWGDREVFAEEAVLQYVHLPQSDWVIGIQPIEGWQTTTGLFQRELVIFYILISIIFLLVFSFSLKYVSKRELSRKDVLTGVFNKHTFENIAKRMIRYSSQKHGVFLIDFNEFKQINDQYGHLAGDTVLKVCSQRISDIVKKTDCVGRIGGDEFMIITMDVETEDNLEDIAKRIIAHVQKPVRFNDIIIRPSVSVGFSLTSNVDAFEQLYDSADKKMYENKEQTKLFTTDSYG